MQAGRARPHQAQLQRQAHLPRGLPVPIQRSAEGACPGYVIDQIRALKHGGTDTPDNMQWQTRAEAKAKDRTE
jgi:hypothetical protein